MSLEADKSSGENVLQCRTVHVYFEQRLTQRVTLVLYNNCTSYCHHMRSPTIGDLIIATPSVTPTLLRLISS